MGMIHPNCALHPHSGMQASLLWLDQKEAILNDPSNPQDSADKRQ